MKNSHHDRSYFIYEVDNIPDHRSRQFGCCPCLLAVIITAFMQTKSRIRAATQIQQTQNQLFAKTIRSALLSYHAGTNKTSRKRAVLKMNLCYSERRTDMKKEISFEKNYLTVADVKSYLCISSTAAYELTHRKDFPVCRLGSSIRIPTDLFLAWVEKHTRIPADLADARKEVNFHVG